jgi:RNA polymerase-binding transcription factor DksA
MNDKTEGSKLKERKVKVLKWVVCSVCGIEVPAVRLRAHKNKRHSDEAHYIKIQEERKARGLEGID